MTNDQFGTIQKGSTIIRRKRGVGVKDHNNKNVLDAKCKTYGSGSRMTNVKGWVGFQCCLLLDSMHCDHMYRVLCGRNRNYGLTSFERPIILYLSFSDKYSQRSSIVFYLLKITGNRFFPCCFSLDRRQVATNTKNRRR